MLHFDPNPFQLDIWFQRLCHLACNSKSIFLTSNNSPWSCHILSINTFHLTSFNDKSADIWFVVHKFESCNSTTNPFRHAIVLLIGLINDAVLYLSNLRIVLLEIRPHIPTRKKDECPHLPPVWTSRCCCFFLFSFLFSERKCWRPCTENSMICPGYVHVSILTIKEWCYFNTQYGRFVLVLSWVYLVSEMDKKSTP